MLCKQPMAKKVVDKEDQKMKSSEEGWNRIFSKKNCGEMTYCDMTLVLPLRNLDVHQVQFFALLLLLNFKQWCYLICQQQLLSSQ